MEQQLGCQSGFRFQVVEMPRRCGNQNIAVNLGEIGHQTDQLRTGRFGARAISWSSAAGKSRVPQSTRSAESSARGVSLRESPMPLLENVSTAKPCSLSLVAKLK